MFKKIINIIKEKIDFDTTFLISAILILSLWFYLWFHYGI